MQIIYQQRQKQKQNNVFFLILDWLGFSLLLKLEYSKRGTKSFTF